MPRQLLGYPGTGGTQHHQFIQRLGVFQQQHQVSAAPYHRHHQRQDPLQGQVRVLHLGAGAQQLRHELLQALAARHLQGYHPRVVLQGLQRRQAGLGIAIAQRAQGGGGQALAPQGQVILPLGLFTLPGVGDQIGEMGRYPLAMRLQHFQVGFPVSAAHHRGHGQSCAGLHRQLLGLPVLVTLDGVFTVAQEQVGRGEFRHRLHGQATQFPALLQHRQQFALLQAEVAPSPDQLEALGDEFHLADTAVSQLDVVFQPAPAHLAGDHLLHAAQALDDPEIHVAAKHEGSQGGHQFRNAVLRTGNRARLDQGVALPVPPLVLVVLFQGGEIVHQGTALAVGPQAHVHAEYKAFRGHLVQGLDHRPAHPGEELLVAQGFALAIGLTRLRKGEDQVYVRGHVELPRPQLAHGQHDQFLALTADPTPGHAETPLQFRLAGSERLGDAGLRQQRGVAHGLPGVRQAAEIAPDDAQHVALAIAPQHHPQLGARHCQLLLQVIAKAVLRQGPPQRPTLQQIQQQGGLAARQLRHKGTAGEHPRQLQPGLAIGRGRQAVGQGWLRPFKNIVPGDGCGLGQGKGQGWDIGCHRNSVLLKVAGFRRPAAGRRALLPLSWSRPPPPGWRRSAAGCACPRSRPPREWPRSPCGR